MSRPEADNADAALAASPAIPRDEEGPVFRAPWEAQAFAMALALHARGAFTWTEWAEALGAEIARAGPKDTGENYYLHWLAALERMVALKGVAGPDEIDARREAWDRAARATPHGEPIVLGRETAR